MEARTRIGEHPKVFLRAPYETGVGQMLIKIELDSRRHMNISMGVDTTSDTYECHGRPFLLLAGQGVASTTGTADRTRPSWA